VTAELPVELVVHP